MTVLGNCSANIRLARTRYLRCRAWRGRLARKPVLNITRVPPVQWFVKRALVKVTSGCRDFHRFAKTFHRDRDRFCGATSGGIVNNYEEASGFLPMI